ncbi:MAG: heme lyase CcmF/NrfE family subunit [Pseudomonadota bacterium]
MIVELSHYAAVIALAAAVFQTAAGGLGAARGDAALLAAARSAAIVQAGLLSLAFAGLLVAFARSDFSLVVIVQNSHTDKPFLYKIAAAWGHHEGSMLLWSLIVALYGAGVARGTGPIPPALRGWTVSAQGALNIMFLLFILLTSNPFARIETPPPNGQELNPILQDPALALHPPMLYLGYVGYSVVFAFAIAALIEGRVDQSWARAVRPWALFSWSALTLGIALGSYWAYYELGWGGWWFWDPVENASFMPWLIGTALLHSVIVTERRGALKSWTLLLAILAFSLSLLGTFLVRSGVLTSVHAFALDPARGVFILAILAAATGGGLALYAWRAPTLAPGGGFDPISREGGIVFNNLIIVASCAAVFIGTLYPLALETATGEKISVGPPYFNLTFGPIVAPILIALPFGPMLGWKRGDLAAASQRLWIAAGVALVLGIVAAAVRGQGPVLAVVALGLGFWLICGAAAEILERARFVRTGVSSGLRRLRHIQTPVWARAVAHAGLGVFVIGVVGATAWRAESVEVIRVGATITTAEYAARLDDVSRVRGANYVADRATFSVSRNGRPVGTAASERRYYPGAGTSTTEVGIMSSLGGDFYLSLGDLRDGGGWVVRANHYPLILFIYIGSGLMAGGALLAMVRRRARAPAPSPAAAPAALKAAE